ncbi:GGDEF domain-containing protein [Vibrio maerlii]|uniref:GGDEF domain-containing protein n=1 Tax=Vibrio maerlii TaxID=2231648 RepID=UPI000E3EC6E0|nr:GGDEF domain-containing protein [Vibrio maerlii]
MHIDNAKMFAARFERVQASHYYLLANNLFGATVFTVYFYFTSVHPSYLVAWFIALAFTLMLRHFHHQSLYSELRRHDIKKSFEWRFSLYPCISGFLWGIGFYLVALDNESNQHMLASIFIFTVAFHGFVVFINSRITYISYYCCIFLPVTAFYLLDGENELVGVSIILSVIYFVFFSQLVHKSSINSLEQDHERTLLVRQLKLSEQHLKKMSQTDHLTNVMNRSAYLKSLGREYYTAKLKDKLLHLAIVDIDHFKRINDKYGHSDGDDVLSKVAAILKDTNASQMSVGRLGGEEFVMFSSSLSKSAFVQLVEKARVQVLETRFDNGIRVSISAGVSELKSEQSITDLIKVSDSALYQAKKSGRNQVVTI